MVVFLIGFLFPIITYGQRKILIGGDHQFLFQTIVYRQEEIANRAFNNAPLGDTSRQKTGAISF